MDILLLGLMAMAALGDNKKTEKKKKKSGKNYRKNDSWLDMAWFHDHNQSL